MSSQNFFNEPLYSKSATVKVLGYLSTLSNDCRNPQNVKLAMPPASGWAHENHVFIASQSYSSPKADFWAQKSIFEK